MRYLVCLVVGLVVGAVIASMAVNAAARRNAWPRGVMNVMQQELGDARIAARNGQCTAATMQDSSAHLRLLAGDLDRALLAPGTKDRVLSQYASDLRDRISQWDAGAECGHQGVALTAIANACDACHRDYR